MVYEVSLRVLRYLKHASGRGLFFCRNTDLQILGLNDVDSGSAWTLEDPFQDIVLFFAIILFHGNQRNRPLYLAPWLKLNIKHLHQPLENCIGF